jgi:hypothetical protein
MNGKRKSRMFRLFLWGKSLQRPSSRSRREYEQIARCKVYEKLTGYEEFRKLMYPNLIFFYGPAK